MSYISYSSSFNIAMNILTCATLARDHRRSGPGAASLLTAWNRPDQVDRLTAAVNWFRLRCTKSCRTWVAQQAALRPAARSHSAFDHRRSTT